MTAAPASFVAAFSRLRVIPPTRLARLFPYRRRRGSRRRRPHPGGRRRPGHCRRAPHGAQSSTITPARLITSGFIDAHVHYPQTQVIGSYGAQLLDWLHNYTFVEEQKFADPTHCARAATFFLDELIRSGTTTAMVYCTVHPQSVDAFFAAAEAAGPA